MGGSFLDIAPPPFWQELEKENLENCLAMRKERMAKLREPSFARLLAMLENLPEKENVITDFSRDRVLIGGGDSCEQIEGMLRELMPWKKGPFEVFGHKIDAEWRSDWKWQRLLGRVGSLEGQRVCDIGCNNGYYMFRMADHKPAFVLGLEPFAKHWFAFQMLNHYAQCENLFLELLGVEHLKWMPKSFDTVFCLGILYHHRDPIGLLEGIRKSLRKKGRLFIDCQGILGDDPVAFIPGPRYAGARGVWFLPTLSGLTNWVRRAGFSQVSVLFKEKLCQKEQRSTPWAPIKSLDDFLDPNDPEKTIEGYPAPYRFYLEVKV